MNEDDISKFVYKEKLPYTLEETKHNLNLSRICFSLFSTMKEVESNRGPKFAASIINSTWSLRFLLALLSKSFSLHVALEKDMLFSQSSKTCNKLHD